MKNVLILGYRYNDNSANNVCMDNIAHELLARGCNVTYIADSDTDEDVVLEQDGITIHALRQTWYSSLKKRTGSSGVWFRFMSLLRHMVLVFYYPNVSPVRSGKVFKKACGIVDAKGIDTVIALYRPYESIRTAVKLKKKYGSRLFVAEYYLDLTIDPNNNSSFAKSIQKKRAYKALAKECETSDVVIMPVSAKKLLNDSGAYIYTDFPVYVPSLDNASADFKYTPDKINIAYVGSIDKRNRNPIYALDFIKALNKLSDGRFALHIWGNVDVDLLPEFDSYEFVNYHGVTSHKYTADLLSNADLLLNICNKNTWNMLPSKVFQQFAAGRPILNFVRNREDCSLPYYSEYGHTVDVYEDRSIDEQVSGAKDLIEAELKGEVTFPDVLLTKCTPGYFVDLIYSGSENRGNNSNG